MKQKSKYSFESVLEDAAGRWPQLFPVLVGGSLNAAMVSAPSHVPCPVNGGKDGFRLFEDWAALGNGVSNQDGVFPNGVNLIAWLLGIELGKALRLVRGALDGESIEKVPVRDLKRKRALRAKGSGQAYLKHNIVKLIDASVEADDSGEVMAYFRKRGVPVEIVPQVIRYIDQARHDLEFEKGLWPCMLALVQRSDGYIVSVHRTFLDRQGRKAPLDKAKLLIKSPDTINGAAIRLSPIDSGELGLSEGIENALSIIHYKNKPCWSCISAQGVESFEPPPVVRTLVVYADIDKSGRGMGAYLMLKQRMKGRNIDVRVELPPSELPILLYSRPKDVAFSADRLEQELVELEASGRTGWVVFKSASDAQYDPQNARHVLQEQIDSEVIWPSESKGFDWLDYFLSIT